MNKFGGNWTKDKIDILVEYAKAYLTIMNKYAPKYNWKLMYFDGFAGSGFIKKETAKEDQNRIIGAAKRILDIEEPMSFDMYYFVEKEEKNATELSKNTKELFSSKNIHIANDDCNNRILKLSKFLGTQEGKQYKVLAYVDPYGMQLNWESIKALENASVDLWVLVPTGLGVNRLLKKDGKISDAWLTRLELFLGMGRQEIKEYFYNERVELTLFGEELKITKEDKAINKSAELYSERLNTLFKFVSKPYILRNASNSIMFHFLMASNNKSAVGIANDIVSKYNKKYGK
jgi:three-Cys-motif partner protein